MMNPRTIFPNSFIEELRRWIIRRERGLHCAMAGMIESYDPATCTATVKPLVSIEHSEDLTEDLGVINEVPVVFPRSSDFIMSFPLQRGDGVLLVFADTSLDAWKAASKGQTVNPNDPRAHHLSDAVAIPGMFNQTFSNTVSDPSAATMRFKDAEIALTASGEILIGKGGGQLTKVATEDFVSDVVTSLATGTGHTHTCSSPGSPSSGPVSGGLLPIAKPAYTTSKVSLE